MKNIWEEIHFLKEWGKCPNEELVRHVGRNFFKIPEEERGKIRILDVGCGQGANLWFLAKNGFDAYGMDISESAIKKTEKFLSEVHKVTAHLIEADAKKLPFDSDYFDAVMDCVTIQHTRYEDHKKAYSEIYRTLKSGGFFWSIHVSDKSWGYASGRKLDFNTFDNLSEGILANFGPVCMLSDEDIETLLKNAGFSGIGIEKNVRTYENQKKEIIHWDIEAKK